MKKIISALLAGLMLTSCQMENPKQMTATLLGGAAGAVAGAQFGKGEGRVATTAIGAMLGAGVANWLAEDLDKRDVPVYNQAVQNGLETGQSGATHKWHNPDTGNSGSITPTKTYEANGTYCREYTQTVTIGGQEKQAYGKACRQADGSWKIVE